MYGLVNRAVKDLVVKEFGQGEWTSIMNLSKLKDDEFIDMKSYDDQLTYTLVESASMVLRLPPEIILKTFGEYWITYTAESGYGELLDMIGKNLDEFLLNLDTVHASVEVSFPDLSPPVFKVYQVTENVWDIRYHSERDGLGPMLEGLIIGLAKRFDDDVTVEPMPLVSNEKNRFRVVRL